MLVALLLLYCREWQCELTLETFILYQNLVFIEMKELGFRITCLFVELTFLMYLDLVRFPFKLFKRNLPIVKIV